jgi:hypothetical protein
LIEVCIVLATRFATKAIRGSLARLVRRGQLVPQGHPVRQGQQEPRVQQGQLVPQGHPVRQGQQEPRVQQGQLVPQGWPRLGSILGSIILPMGPRLKRRIVH